MLVKYKLSTRAFVLIKAERKHINLTIILQAAFALVDDLTRAWHKA